MGKTERTHQIMAMSRHDGYVALLLYPSYKELMICFFQPGRQFDQKFLY